MDPFSISVGVISIVVLVGNVIKGAERLRSSLQANDQICALINELTDMKCVLTAADVNQGQLSPERASHIQNIVDRAEEKLSELDLIINTRLLKTKFVGKELRSYRMAWLREKSKAELIQKELRYLSSAFSLALTASTSGGVRRIELAVTTLATTAERSSDAQRAFHGATEARLNQVYQALQSLNLQHTYLLDKLESQTGVIAGSAEKALPFQDLQRHSHNSTTVCTTERDPLIGSYFRIQTTRASYRCGSDGECCCRCHARRRIRSPAALDKIMGMLFMGYTGLPASQRPCDLHSCRNQQRDFLAHFTYYFPWWFVERALVATVSLNTAVGPDFTFRVLHIVPDSSSIFQLAKSGNIHGIKYLFQNSLASPNDIGGELGFTALHVSILNVSHLSLA
jgi:hypothetical protein